jgi:predicted O-methyltransferase YrrM
MFNALMTQIYQTGEVEDGQGSKIKAQPSPVTPETAEVLYRLVTDHKMARTMEVGLAYGLSALSICQAHKDKGGGFHLAMDPAQNTFWKSIGLLNVKRAGLENLFRFHEGFSHSVLPELVKEGGKYQMCFIDGSHLFDVCLLDFFYSDLLIDPGGILVFDDMWMPAVQKVVKFVLSNRLYEKLDAGKAYNISIVRKLAWDNRAWDYHAEF